MYIKNHSFCQGERKRFLILVQEPDLEIKTHLARKGKAEEGGGQWSNDQRGLRSTPHWLHKTFSEFQVSSKQSENTENRNYILYFNKRY